MRNRKRKPFHHPSWFAAAPLFLALATASCSDPGEPLPGGYFIFIVNSSEMILNEPKYRGSIPELGTDLEEIGHHNEFIFGRSGSARRTTPGYFLLNTRTGVIKTGLSESDWLRLTAEAGIPNPPVLVDPARQRPNRR